MGRRERHTAEAWEEAKRRQGSEPQGSPPPGEDHPRAKVQVLDDEPMVIRPTTLRPPASVPAPIKPDLDQDVAAIMERVLLTGDLSNLTEEERVSYYMAVCKSVGLNPLTRPFAYIVLNGALTLYARKDCADQLRRINGISIEIVDRKVANDLLTIHVRAMDKYGRVDEDVGSVDVYEKEGDVLANSVMRAVTKAKRRVTLSISGLGFLDETEVADVVGADQPSGPRHHKKGRGRKAKGEPVVTIQPLKAGEKKPLPPLVQRQVEVVPEDDPG